LWGLFLNWAGECVFVVSAWKKKKKI